MKADLRGAHTRCFWQTFVFMVLFALSFCLMPSAAEDRMEGKNGLLILAGGGFWISAILWVSGLWRMRRLRKRICARSKIKERKELPGLLRFFQNPEALAADILLIAGILAFVVLRLYQKQINILFPAVSGLLLLLFLHGMLNGKNYFLVRGTSERTRRESEKRNST